MKFKRRWYSWRTTPGYIFVTPFVVGAVFIFLPSLAESLIYSFSTVTIDFSRVIKEPVGFANYHKALFVNVAFRELLLNGVRGMLVDSILIMIFSFFVANILNQRFIGRSFARMIFFLPVILTSGIVAGIEVSTAASLLASGSGAQAGGSSGLALLSNLSVYLQSLSLNQTLSELILYAVNNTYSIVNASGVQIIVFLSALQSIPSSLFEASKVEGATKWEEFWKITFPIITPMIFVNMVYTIIDSFTNPTYGILNYIRTQGFGYNEMGFASAMSWIYFAVILVLLGVLSLIFIKRTTYIGGR